MDMPIKSIFWKYLVNTTFVLAIVSLNACGGGTGSSSGGTQTNASQTIMAYSINGASGVIDTTTKVIAVTLPFGTSVTALVATFSTTGSSITVGGLAQLSAITSNDFTNPVVYLVTAADGSTTSYTVIVTVAASSAKAITSYSLNGITGSINETSKTIGVVMPFGTSVTALVATFSTTGSSITVGGLAQLSAITSNDFTNPVVYLVTAADGSTTSYTVIVTVAASSAKAITSYSLNGITGSINEATKSIGVVMPFGTSVTALVATFSTTGSSVTVGGLAQISTITGNNFTSPVLYLVTAADGANTSYTVTVTVASSSAKAITIYSLNGMTGLINESAKTIGVVMPFGTSVTALVATFSTTGSSVAVGGVAQLSTITGNSFTSPVIYQVTAADGSNTSYTVTVTVALSSAKAMTSYSLNGITGSINETSKTIGVVMPFGTSVTALVATFSTTGSSITVGDLAQLSAITSNDFTNPVVYLVTAADGSTTSYTVIVTVAASSAKAITSYSLNGITGSINEATKSIGVVMPFGSSVTSLVATFATTGTNITVGGVAQLSTITNNDFTSPAIYLVTAADGSNTSYTVTVTVAPLSLGAAGSYVLLANSTITNAGPSIITGNIGLYPGTSITGFPPGTSSGTVDIDNLAASNAQNALISAYNQAASLTPTTILSAATYITTSNQTLTPGTYSVGTSMQVIGNLILSGNVNSVFVFQVGSTFTTAVGSNIVLLGGVNPANVYWQVGSSATLGTSSELNGVLLANVSVTTNTSSVINGRIFAVNGAITLDTNSITAP
jgi:hypothetical protein